MAGEMMWVRILLLAILVCLLIFMWRIPVVDEKQQSTEASSWRLQLWRTASKFDRFRAQVRLVKG